MSGILYLVGTPVGNLGDLAPRARETLARVATAACEDTRTCRRLYHWLGVPAPRLIAYHDHNAETALPAVLERLAGGEEVALVTDAGMPAIQDPGYRLVAAARRRGVPVVPVPGPSALVLALSASGLPTDRFAFLGFPPRRGRERWWREALARCETIVVYEAAGRVARALAEIGARDPDRPVCLARELTKLHEEFVIGPVREVAEKLAGREEDLRGECVLVVGGAGEDAIGAVPWREALDCLKRSRAGRELSGRDVVDVLTCVYPAGRNAIYEAVIAGWEEP
ncbi:MAG TPA: 16S rRNA (cytidine(1402)-2'-O)-methyltransferase [Gemmatimonadota bacterium]|nr:16S rRNA (cytidine(1402)-2'-O)-methyltransferase [Gemmatimonadota bacterium]